MPFGSSFAEKFVISAAGGDPRGRVSLRDSTFQRRSSSGSGRDGARDSDAEEKDRHEKERRNAKESHKEMTRQLDQGGLARQERDALKRDIEDLKWDLKKRLSSFEAWDRERKQQKRLSKFGPGQEIIDAAGEPSASGSSGTSRWDQSTSRASRNKRDILPGV